MSQHKDQSDAGLNEALKQHSLPHDTPSQLADAFRNGYRAALARTHQPKAAPLAGHADHVPEIAARLRLVAKLASVPDAVPADDLTAVGCIFSVLGNMRLAMERKAQQPAQVVPDGFVLVPVEPSDDMLTVGALAHEASPCHDLIGPIGDAWAAMLAASQHGERAE